MPSAVFNGPFQIADLTGALNVLEIATGANRIGLNGVPDGTNPLSIGGSVFVDNNIRFPAASAIPRAASPFSGFVFVAANSTATVTHNDGQIVLAGVTTSQGQVEQFTTNDFVVRNTTPNGLNLDIFYW